MPLGKEVGLGPGHNVLDGNPVGTQRPPQQPLPSFWSMSPIVTKRSLISAALVSFYNIELSCQQICDFVVFLFSFSCIINVRQFRQFLGFRNLSTSVNAV